MQIVYCFGFGFLAGLTYLLLCFVRRQFNFNHIVGFVLDLLWGVVAGILYGLCIMLHLGGKFRLYSIICYFLGIIIIVITLNNLVASVSNFVYNKISKKIFCWLKKLIVGRKNNESKKIDTTC